MLRKVFDNKTRDKAAHDERWSPAVHRKAKAQKFALIQRNVDRVSVVGYRHKLFAGSLTNLTGCPQGVARCRKVEYHGTKLQKQFGLNK